MHAVDHHRYSNNGGVFHRPGLTELYIAGMEPFKVLKTRLIMVPMMVLTGRPYGAWRDWFFATTKPTVSWSKSLIDGVAFLTFQLPVYGLTLWMAGAARDEILTQRQFSCLLSAAPFGLVLETARKLAGVKAD
jgi:L-alanine exporter